MPETESLSAALLTPPGRGAIAAIGLCGPQAALRIDSLFHSVSAKSLRSAPLRTILYGRWQDAVAGEELVVCRTQSDQVEIFCHGGNAAAAAILASLVEHGAKEMSWVDWIRQSANDPLAAAALHALAEARTERAAAILLAQARGALRREINAAAMAIRENRIQEAKTTLASLIARAAWGIHLTQPWRIVLSGPPNAGKSSLLNVLLGYTRAVVHATPGTTRDVLVANTAVEGWPVELCDTAGLRPTDDRVERLGVALALSEAQRADLVILVRDVTAPPEGKAFASWDAGDVPPEERLLHVWNKCDLPAAPETMNAAGLRVSARTEAGVPQLLAAIAAKLVPDPPAFDAAVPFAESQRTILASALQWLDSNPAASAAKLDSLLGRH